MQEIASAFVRIRPNMAGFKAETQTGVKSAFLGVGKSIAALLAVKGTFDFFKGAVDDAAAVQKSLEVVKSDFGRFSEDVSGFAEHAGVQLGILSHTSLDTSAKFGILFRNLGIGEGKAAEMTVGLEKLAGSLAQIRGADPAEILSRLPLVMLGNLRSLKLLGFSFDNAQVKARAFSLGLISSVKEGLNPSIKAQAIYSLVTQHLSSIQDQARKHSGDLVNVQKRLRAEWDKAREAIGTALLPALTKVATALANWLAKMNESGRITKNFTVIAHSVGVVVLGVAAAIKTSWTIFNTAAGWIGGAKQAIVAFLAVLAVKKILAFATAIKVQLIEQAFVQLGITVQAEKDTYLAAFGEMEIATIGFAATVKAALISTGIGALIVGLGIAASEIITHWSTVKRWMTEFFDFLRRHLVIVGTLLFGAFGFAAAEIITHWSQVKAFFVGFAHFFSTVFTHPLRAVEQAFSSMWSRIKARAIRAVLDIIQPFTHLPGWLGGGVFRRMRESLESTLQGMQSDAAVGGDAIGRALGNGIAAGFQITFDPKKQVGSFIAAAKAHAAATTKSLGDKNPFGVEGFKIPIKYQLEISKAEDSKNKSKIRAALLDEKAWLLRLLKNTKLTPEDRNSAIQELTNIKDQLVGVGSSASSFTVPLRYQIEIAQANLTANKAKITAALADEASWLRRVLKTHLSSADKLSALQELDSVMTQMNDIAKSGAKNVGDSVANAMTEAMNKMGDALVSAKQNLNTIGASLAGDLAEVISKGNQLAGAIGGPAEAQLKKLMALIHAGVAGPDVIRAAQALQNQVAAAQTIKSGAQSGTSTDAITRKLADLTDLLNKGAIGTMKEFRAKLAAILKSTGVTPGSAKKALGVAGADQFNADVKGLLDQAAAIFATPGHKLGGNGLEPSIVRPIDDLRAAEQTNALAAHRQREKMLIQQSKTVAEARKHTHLLNEIEKKQNASTLSPENQKWLRWAEKHPQAVKNALHAGLNGYGH